MKGSFGLKEPPQRGKNTHLAQNSVSPTAVKIWSIGILVCKEFQVFKDYFGLANVLKEIQREKTSGNLYDGSFTNRPCQPSLSNKPTVPVDQKLDCSVGCGFCNGEHRLKNPYSGKIRCPVLRSYTCSICNATGDKAHTKKYCPRQYCYSKNYKRSFIHSFIQTCVRHCGFRRSPGNLFFPRGVAELYQGIQQ